MPPVTELERAIHAQPDELRRIAGLELPRSVKRIAAGERVWLVGTGTSWHAAELGAAMLERAGVDARFATSNEFARRSPLRAGDAAIVLSHTGETAYARAAHRRALDIGAPVLGITAEGAGLARLDRDRAARARRDLHAQLHDGACGAGADRRRARRRGAGPEAVLAAADATEAALATPDEIPEARRLTAFAGLGPGQVTAREGALKLREAARLVGEGYDAEYLLHGNAVPLGADDVLVLVGGDADGFVDRLAEIARSAGVATAELEQPAPADELMAQIPLTARLQRLALERALAGGQDPDKVILAPWDDEALWAVGSP